MTKYLSVIQLDGRIGGLFHDDQTDDFNFFSLKNQEKLEKVIEEYEPEVLISRQNYAPPLLFGLKIISPAKIKELESGIIEGTIKIEGLERRTDKGYYPVYSFREEELQKPKRWALYALYLYKEDPITNQIIEKKELNKVSNVYQKIIDMNQDIKDFQIKVEVIKKLNYLGNLTGQELKSLVRITTEFNEILNKFLPLKLQEEKYDVQKTEESVSESEKENEGNHE